MGPLLPLLLICFLCCIRVSTVDARKHDSQSPPRASLSNTRLYRSSIDRFVDKLFQETDTNNDGMVSFEEAYIGVLLLYVQLNRSAPIPPPNREKFRRIFLKAAARDKTTNPNALDMEEYGDVLKTIVARAVLRLTSHKIVTLAGAPLLAEMIARSLAARKDGFEALLRSVIPSQFHDATIPTITSRAFHRGLWMVILITTLGNVCLGIVTFLLDMSLPKLKCQSKDDGLE
eukprot:jgi/Psemu1/306305/fgenesh1_kg.248_\